MKREVSSLTEAEARQLFEFVFPPEKYPKYYFGAIQIKESNPGQVTMGFRPIIGILYNNGQDNCIIHFDDSKALIWLYEHEFDILEQLKYNADHSDTITDYDNAMFELHWAVKQKDKHETGYLESVVMKVLEFYYGIEFMQEEL